jgi:hypothetical protein
LTFAFSDEIPRSDATVAGVNTSIRIMHRAGRIGRWVVGILLGVSAAAQPDPPPLEPLLKPVAPVEVLSKPLKQRGTYMELTGSRIKQRVGRTPTRAATMMPVIVYDSSTINRSGAGTVAQFLSRSSVGR